jgi:soluble lytic murein transglycosylase-like protein
MSRIRLAALTLAVSAALSGAPVRLPAPDSADVAAQRADGVAERIRFLNGALSGAEAQRIWEAVDRYSARYELAPDLVLGVLEVESHARVGARSSKGALGLMQVMPHMASALDLAGNHTTIESNIEAGCLILAHNIRRLGEEDGVSAYFWGSDIRGVSYLNRVTSAREAYRRILAP